MVTIEIGDTLAYVVLMSVTAWALVRLLIRK